MCLVLAEAPRGLGSAGRGLSSVHPCRLGGVRASQTGRILELLRPLPEQSTQKLKGRFPKASSVDFHAGSLWGLPGG